MAEGNGNGSNGRALFIGNLVLALALLAGVAATVIGPITGSARQSALEAAELAQLKERVGKLERQAEEAVRGIGRNDGRLDAMVRELSGVDELAARADSASKWMIGVYEALRARDMRVPEPP